MMDIAMTMIIFSCGQCNQALQYGLWRHFSKSEFTCGRTKLAHILRVYAVWGLSFIQSHGRFWSCIAGFFLPRRRQLACLGNEQRQLPG